MFNGKLGRGLDVARDRRASLRRKRSPQSDARRAARFQMPL
jgi:hypothetical protein